MAHLQQLKSRELLKIRDLQQFSGFTTIENGFSAAQRYYLYFIFIFISRKVDFIMLLQTLLQVINSSNFLGIHELTADGKSYDMVYTGQIKTRSEMEKIIRKYGKREVKEIDTSIDEGQLIYIELER